MFEKYNIFVFIAYFPMNSMLLLCCSKQWGSNKINQAFEKTSAFFLMGMVNFSVYSLAKNFQVMRGIAESRLHRKHRPINTWIGEKILKLSFVFESRPSNEYQPLYIENGGQNYNETFSSIFISLKTWSRHSSLVFVRIA